MSPITALPLPHSQPPGYCLVTHHSPSTAPFTTYRLLPCHPSQLFHCPIHKLQATVLSPITALPLPHHCLSAYCLVTHHSSSTAPSLPFSLFPVTHHSSSTAPSLPFSLLPCHPSQLFHCPIHNLQATALSPITVLPLPHSQPPGYCPVTHHSSSTAPFTTSRLLPCHPSQLFHCPIHNLQATALSPITALPLPHSQPPGYCPVTHHSSSTAPFTTSRLLPCHPSQLFHCPIHNLQATALSPITALPLPHHCLSAYCPVTHHSSSTAPFTTSRLLPCHPSQLFHCPIHNLQATALSPITALPLPHHCLSAYCPVTHHPADWRMWMGLWDV